MSLLHTFFHRHVRGSTPQVVIPIHGLNSSGHYVGWSPANTTIAISVFPNLSLRDLTTGETLRQWRHESQMAWSPDGSLLLTHCLSDGRDWTLQIRDANTGELRCTYDAFCGNCVYDLAWSPDGTRIAHSTNQDREKRVYIWDARSGASLLEYRGHQQSSYVDKVCWSPDSTLLLSYGVHFPQDRTQDGTAQLWQSADGTLVRRFSSQEIWGNVSRESHVQTVKHVIAAVNAASPIPFSNFWDAFTQQCLIDPRYLGLMLSGDWSPDGQHLALIDGDMIVLLNWQTGKQERSYGGHLRDKPYLYLSKVYYGPRSLSWSRDGKRIASIDPRGRVHIWPTSVSFPWLPWPKEPVKEWK